jgi:hypothetical protein
MPISNSDIKWFKSELISDTSAAQNGGYMSNNEIISNTKNNVWPDVTQAERLAGSTKYRKNFIKINSDPSIDLLNTKIFIDAPSIGDDFLVLQYDSNVVTAQVNDQTDLTGFRHYGIGALKTSASIGGTTITVTVENSNAVALSPFDDDDLLWISNQASVADDGDFEYITADTVTYSGSDAIITLTSGLANDWTVGDTPIKVSSVIDVGTVKASYEECFVTSTAGVFDHANGIVLNGTGAIEQLWALVFTSATAFNLSGTTLGNNIATGSISTDYTYTNTAFNKPYFKLLASAFTGTFAINDVIIFTTHPASVPYWEKRIIPANSNSIANTGSRVAITGESA